MKNGKTERTDKQRTKTGLEIPVPTRGEFMRNLAKTAKPVKPVKPVKPPKKSPTRRPKK